MCLRAHDVMVVAQPLFGRRFSGLRKRFFGKLLVDLLELLHIALEARQQLLARAFPAGDAVLPSMVEKGRCLTRMQRKDEARELFARIVREHPNGLEGGTARQLLTNLDLDSGRQ